MVIISTSLTIFTGIILVLLFFYFFPIGNYFYAKFEGVEIPLLRMSHMRLRKAPVQDIVNCKIRLHNAGIDIELEYLEAHSMTSGNIINVTDGLIYAKENGYKVTFKEATEIDLRGLDLIEFAKQKTIRN